jgi:PBSX family phage terminase large subunit
MAAEILINSKFEPLFQNKTRYFLLTGGRGSSKSFTVSLFLSYLSYEERQRILFTRYTMQSAETSVIPEFTKKIELLGAQNDFDITNTLITNRHSKVPIIFSGIKASSGIQTAKLKGVDATTWVNDEMEEFVDEETFNVIDYSIRTKDCQNRIIMVMNPSDKSHFIYRKFIEKTNRVEYIDGYPVEISTHPDCTHIHTTYIDNIANLDDNIVKGWQQMKIESPKYYGNKIIGQWNDIAEGALFPKVNLKRFKEGNYKYEATLSYIDVSDEGSDSTCMMVAKVIGRQIHIVDIVFSDSNADVTIPMCASSLNSNGVNYCRVETNSMGGLFMRSLQPLTKAQCLGATSTSNKHTRIYMDSVFINENFYFKENGGAMYEQALNQMSTYTKDGKAKHDDAADCASGLAMFIRGVLPHIFV